MALIGREDELEQINKSALRMAREVADQTGTLMAGNISNTNIFLDTVPNYRQKIWQMFKVSVDKMAIKVNLLLPCSDVETPYSDLKGLQTI